MRKKFQPLSGDRLGEEGRQPPGVRAADTMISTNELKTGTTIEIDGDVYTVVEFQHVKPGKGAAFVRTKIKNLQTGATFERTFRAGEKLPRARVERREMRFVWDRRLIYVHGYRKL